MAKKESLKNFRVDEDFDRWLGGILIDLDCNLSELIRTSLLLSVPVIKSNPALIRMISLDQFKSQ